MKKNLLFVLIAVVAMMVSCKQEQQNQEQEQPTDEKVAVENPQMAMIQTIKLGQELALYGYNNESAEALIEAANILMSIPTQDLQAVTEKTQGTGEQGEKTSEKRSMLPADLLAKAKEFAGEDATLLAMIQKAEERLADPESCRRGAECGGSYLEDTVDSNGSVSYSVTFNGNELAECAVVGDGDTDLDLYVYDSQGLLVAKDIDYDVNCYCSWYPQQKGVYVLKVVNRGNVYNNFIIAVN